MKYNLRNLLFYMKYKNTANNSDRISKCKENLYEAVKENVEFFTNSDNYMYANPKMYFTVPMSSLLQPNGMTLDKLIEIQEQFNTSATGLFGLKYDNLASIVLIDSYGHPFLAHCGKDNWYNIYGLCVWDMTGSIPLCCLSTKDNKLTNEQYAALCKCHEKLVKHYKEV